jgi:hypothetical protein
LKALIKTGKYSSPVAEQKLFEILKIRRDKIANHWFRKSVAPLDRFRIENNRIGFDDLAVEGGYDCRGCPSYKTEITEDGATIITRTSPGWPEQKVTVYTRRVNGKLSVLGLER